MIFKVFGVLQFILTQVISAQISNRDLSRQNALNNLYSPLAEYGRSRRQIRDSSVGLPGNGNLAANGFAYGTPFKNNLPNGNFLRGNKLPNNFALKNGLPINFALNNELPNSSPHIFPFTSMNVMPQNRLLPSFNDVISNGLPFNNVPNGLPFLNNGLPGLNNRLPGLNNGLPGSNNGLPDLNNGLPSFNNVPSGLPYPNNGWPSLINVPNVLPGSNNVPNGLPGLNNVPKVLPNLNNNPTFTNKVLNLNNMPAGSNILNLNNFPAANTLPNINNIAIPNALSSFNNLPCNPLPLSKGLPLNNLPSGNILSPINNQLPYLNNFRITEIGIGNELADINRFPRDNQPVDNMSPNANNFQNVNELRQQVSDELTNMNNYQNKNGFLSIANIPSASALLNIVPVNNMSPNANNLQNINELRQQVPDELTNMNNYQNNNEFFSIANIHSASALPNNVPVNNMSPNAYNLQNVNELRQQVENRFSSVNNFPISSGISNIVNDVQNINNMQLNNGLPDDCHFHYNAMPVNEQQFVNIAPFNNDFAVLNNVPKTTGMPNFNSRMVNAIDNGMPLSNGLLAKRGLPETYSQESDGSGFSSNDFQFGNIQMPVNNWHYDFVPSKMPANQNLLLSEGVQMFSNVPNDYSSVLTSNNLNLAQELVKNLQIEDIANIPFLNGLPIAGITETVTVLNGPYSK